MPNGEMNNGKFKNYENKINNNNTTINEKTAMLEVSSTIPKPKKRDYFKYKYHLIASTIIIIIFILIIKNISQIKIFFKERNLERNLMRNFSEIDSTPTPSEGVPLYWKDEKKLNIQKVKREINSYIKDPVLLFNNKEDFIKRENPKVSLIIPVYNKETFLLPLYKSIADIVVPSCKLCSFPNSPRFLFCVWII